ncbi:MAG TPA: hypothetical protein VGK73_34520 [Polyangiaceae bacterium]
MHERTRAAFRRGAPALGLFVLVGSSCSQHGESSVGRTHEGLGSEAARVLGFESAADWSSAAALSNSTDHSQGAHSLAVAAGGWAEVASIPLGSLGSAGASLSYDIKLPSSAAWGETRVIVQLPSKGFHWSDLGSRPLAGLAPGVFHRVEFPLPPALVAALGQTYSDLKVRIVINGPAGSYRLDDLELAVEPETPPLPPAATSFTVSVDLPGTIPLAQVALAGVDGVSVGSQAHIGGVVANTGSGLTTIQAAAHTGSVLTTGNLFLGSGAQISGSVLAAGTIERQNGVTVAGTIFGGAGLGTTTVAEWTVRQSAEYQAGVQLEPGQVRTLGPDSYGFLRVQPGATATLRAGQYFIDRLVVQSGGQLSIDDSSGPVVVYVTDELNLQGSVESSGEAPARLLAVHRGQQAAFVRAPFEGAVIAPEATVTLAPFGAARFKGSFFAKQLVAQGSVLLDAVPFDPTTLTTARGGGVNWPDAQVIRSVTGDQLRARLRPDGSSVTGSWSPGAPAQFVIPARLEVESGNARSGSAELTIDQAGTPVVCSYAGGSPTSPPATSLDRAKGLFYEFVACSNGAAAGTSIEGSHFELELDDDESEPDVTVLLSAGNGCADSIGYPIDPAESIEMRDGFSWAGTTPLPELDAQGRPNLFYAGIYLRTPSQRQLLDELFVYYRGKPLLSAELAKFYGKCGSINYSGDGEGVFVFAILPAKTYNLIRAAALDPGSAGDPDVFDAVILRELPEEAATDDGAFSYEVLFGAGFEYVARGEEEPGEAPGAPGFGDFIRSGADALEDTYHGIRNVAGEVDQVISGSVQLRVYLSALEVDPTFGDRPPLRRTWGAKFGWEMPLEDLKITVEHSRFGLNIHSEYADTNENGIATMNVAEGTVAEAVCVDLEHPAARFEQFLERDEICDYRGELGEFDSSRRMIWQSDNRKLHSMAQFIDGRHYLRDVAGYTPPRATVLVGRVADTVSADTAGGDRKRPYAPCLGFDSMTTTVSQDVQNTFLLPVALLMTAVSDIDIVLPANSSTHDSRVASHEYGHYVMCALIDERNPARLPAYWAERIAEGSEEDSSDQVTVMSESFADLFASQLVSGVSKFEFDEWDDDSSVSESPMSYCALRAETNRYRLNCLEGNRSFGELHDLCEADCADDDDVSDCVHDCDFDSRVAVNVLLYNDVFDGHLNAGGRDVPMDGRAWVQQEDDSLAAAHWNDFNAPDEPVALAASSLRGWIARWVDNGFPFDRHNALVALNQEMKAQDKNWCERCQVFALHSETPHGGQGFSFRRALEECADSTVAGWLEGESAPGPVDALSTNCEPCPEGEATDPFGVCHPVIVFEEGCEEGQGKVDGECSECPEGSRVYLSECFSCPPEAPYYDPFNVRGCVVSCRYYDPVDGICPPFVQ